MSVSRGDKVAVVLRERHGEHSAGNFVGGDDRTFLLTHTKTGGQNVTALSLMFIYLVLQP